MKARVQDVADDLRSQLRSERYGDSDCDQQTADIASRHWVV
jgi:hypothetical protein